MFTVSPRYAKLSQQVAQALETEIRRGAWPEHLPGERHLAESMQVSRRTIRAALDILRQKNLLGTVHGFGTKILSAPTPERGAARPLPNFGLLLPASIEQLRPQTMVFIDSLRALLYANGFRLDTHISQRFFSGRPAAALRKLVAQFPHDGWILTLSTRANQIWFQEQGLPTLVVGTAHKGVDLPYVDTDMRATCHHAASQLLRRGHRQIALLMEKSDKAGDRQTEEGFLAGVRDFGRAGASAAVFRHGGTVMGIRQLVSRLINDANRPTALFLVNPYHYLTVASVLAEKGLRVPRDMSLLSRDDDPFLSYQATEPARYVCSPQRRAKVAFSILMRMREGGRIEPKLGSLLLPDFVAGASIAEPARLAGGGAT